MSAELTVVSLFPDILDVNGDSANAAVLQTRLRWMGFQTRLIGVQVGENVPSAAPDIVVIGSGSDEDLTATLTELRRIESPLREWVEAEVPILAVGTSWELLSHYVETGTQAPLKGLGIFPGHSMPAKKRITGELVVDSEFGRLFGFENHVRQYTLGAGGVHLGTVVCGSGNASAVKARGFEGAIVRNAIGTHLHGPVLARNPVLADHLISLAQARSTDVSGATAKAELHAADAMARAACAVIATQLGLTAEKKIRS